MVLFDCCTNCMILLACCILFCGIGCCCCTGSGCFVIASNSSDLNVCPDLVLDFENLITYFLIGAFSIFTVVFSG